jgi:hypothetical protein
VKETKAIVSIEVKVGEVMYQFLMPVGTPLGSAYDAAHQVLMEIVELANKAAENAKPKDSAAKEIAED